MPINNPDNEQLAAAYRRYYGKYPRGTMTVAQMVLVVGVYVGVYAASAAFGLSPVEAEPLVVAQVDVAQAPARVARP